MECNHLYLVFKTAVCTGTCQQVLHQNGGPGLWERNGCVSERNFGLLWSHYTKKSMFIWMYAQNKSSMTCLKICKETIFGCISKHREALGHHQSIIKVLQHFAFPRACRRVCNACLARSSETNLWKHYRHYKIMSPWDTVSLYLLVFQPRKWDWWIDALKYAGIHPRAWRQNKHTERTHSQGTRCKSKACYVQTDQGKSKAPRMRREIQTIQNVKVGGLLQNFFM